MTGFPAPNRQAHRDFCRIEGWTEVTSATGGAVRHHPTFELVLPDSTVLRTHISHPISGSKTYGRGVWATILRDQLHVTEEEFWGCVQRRILPDRGGVARPSESTLPAALVQQLIAAGVPEHDVLAMSRQQAIAAMTAIWSSPKE